MHCRTRSFVSLLVTISHGNNSTRAYLVVGRWVIYTLFCFETIRVFEQPILKYNNHTRLTASVSSIMQTIHINVLCWHLKCIDKYMWYGKYKFIWFNILNIWFLYHVHQPFVALVNDETPVLSISIQSSELYLSGEFSLSVIWVLCIALILLTWLDTTTRNISIPPFYFYNIYYVPKNKNKTVFTYIRDLPPRRVHWFCRDKTMLPRF